MSKDYEIYIDRLAENSIIMKGQINDVVFGLKGITDKLDTLIALKQVELSLLQQQRLPEHLLRLKREEKQDLSVFSILLLF